MKLTLTSNNLISRYICIYAYEQIKNINDTKNNNNVNYLYDHTLPSWDYIPHNDRKKLKVMCLTIGNYEIPYKDTIIYLKIQYVKDRPLILDYDIVKEVILECSNADFLIEFVETAKKTTEDTLNREGRNLDSTIRKYIYDTTVSHPDWEIINICKKRFTETLFLPKDIRKNIFGFIDDFISEDTKKQYSDYGIPYKCNMLFSGVPGSGKTTTIHCIASHINSDIGIISFTRAMDDLQFTKAINSMSKLENCRVLVLEDIDGLFSDERKQHDSAKNSITLSGILNCLDGLSRNEGIIVCITTNRKEVLDDAILRSGRMDIDIEFNYIKKEQIEDMLLFYYKDATLVESFYDKIQHYQLTASDFQQFLFKYRHTPNEIMKKYKELQKKSEKTNNKLYS